MASKILMANCVIIGCLFLWLIFTSPTPDQNQPPTVSVLTRIDDKCILYQVIRRPYEPPIYVANCEGFTSTEVLDGKTIRTEQVQTVIKK